MASIQVQKHFDVVVVGAGAVGVLLALALQRLHYSVAVIEQQPATFVSTNPERVVALNYGSRCYLESLGLWPAIVAAGLGNIAHIVVSEVGNRGRVDLDATALARLDGQAARSDDQALGYVVEMGKLLEPMYVALQAADVSMISPASVVDYDVQSDQVVVQVQQAGERMVISADLLVGADGTYSQMRKMAGLETYGWDYNRFALVASVTCALAHNGTAHECFRSSGPLAFLPLEDGRYSIVWALTPGQATQLLAMDDSAFMAALQAAAGRATMDQIGEITAVSQRASFPLELRIAKSFSAPRFALVGNAAHTIHPVAGQGMNLGFRDVQCLIEVLEQAKTQQDGKADVGQAILMQAYAEKRCGDVIAVAGFTESMLHVFGSRMPGLKWLRGLGMDKLSLFPFLADLLLKQASGVGQMGSEYVGSEQMGSEEQGSKQQGAGRSK